MITFRHLFGLSVAMFVFGFALVIGGAVLEASSGRNGVLFLMPGLLAAGLGVLAAWSGALFKQQSARIDRLEAKLHDRTAS